MKTRYEQRRDHLEAVVRMVAAGVILVILALILVGAGMEPEVEPPSARERAAQFAAQERYYETVERYGDVAGAVETAKWVYDSMRGGEP